MKNNSQNWTNNDINIIFRKLYDASEKPVPIGFHFIRDNKRLYDWINMVQLPQDLMKDYGWIDDDNIECMIPYPLQINNAYTTYDKENPGVLIKIGEDDIYL